MQVRHTVTFFPLGARANLLDEGTKPLFSPIVARRALGAPGIARARSLQQRFSCSFVIAGITARGKRVVQ